MRRSVLRRSRAALLALCASFPLISCAGGDHGPAIRPVTKSSAETKVTAFDNAYETGKAQLRAGRAGLALVMFEKAAAIDPRSVAALNAIGTAYDELHDPGQAATSYEKAMAIEPQSADTLNNMGISAILSGKPEKGRELLQRALAIDPDNGTIRQNLGLLDHLRKEEAEPPDIRPPNRPILERAGEAKFILTIPEQRAEIVSIVLPPPQ